ncbi:MAG: hypothetical protein EZS28_012871 [Streblomastix strix]|uniref:OTU domain-containing protein n=1 Tax=Streblomastix strix TaxID=222440 RepID=A0A5J4WAD0_9EUKA|nr:MAG: hypothetical protein EZS28_012871 [Streblomastix strix]
MNVLVDEASNQKIYARSRAKQLKLQPLVLKFSSTSLFQEYTSEIIKDVRTRGKINMDEINLCEDGGIKVAKSKGKKWTVGAIKDTDPGLNSPVLSFLRKEVSISNIHYWRYEAEVEENIDQYIAKMSSSHEWADGPILEATGREYRRQINVSLPSGQSYSLNPGQGLHINLGFVSGTHYTTFVKHNKE